jgi:hypothetical protein
MRRLLFTVLAACTGSEEAAKVELPVTTLESALPAATTDLGYQVQVTRLRIAVDTIQFTIEGEMHEDVARTAPGALAPPLPHPGHYAGGEVTGELPGKFVLTWEGKQQPMLGNATLIVGDYHGANFNFRAADASDGLAAGDPFLGHAMHVEGMVSKDGTTKPFHALLDVELDTQLVGAVFEDKVAEGSHETLAIEFYPTDPFEHDTPFDAVDFFSLPETSGAIEIVPGSAAHNIIRRAIQTHDHYGVVAE